jgi:flagellar motor component MotA
VKRWLIAPLAGLVCMATALATADPAGATVAGINIVWDINLTTVFVVVGGAFTWWLTVQRQGDKVKAHDAALKVLTEEIATKVEAETVKKVQESVEGWKLKALALESAFTAFKEEVYKHYLSMEAFREIKNELRADAAGTEKRIMESIRDLSDRVDEFASARGR